MRTTITYGVLFLLIAAAFIPLPYYISQPGGAHDLDPLVHVEGGDDDDTGTLMLTTIRMGQANVYAYAWAMVRDFQKIVPKEQVRYDNETEEEYEVRQQYLMDSSKQHAVSAAFEKAGQPYTLTNKGVFVLGVYPGMPAEKAVEAGDRITAVDGEPIESSKEMTAYVQAKKPGDAVTFSVERDGKSRQERIQVESFAALGGKSGIGISLANHYDLTSSPPVDLDSDEIGGPSAGLMFALEIYDQLMEEDIAAGLRVAGTGTIEPDGTVGRIGGIDQKVVAADRAGADFFLAPDDPLPENKPDAVSNYEEAKAAAETIGTSMKIIPVKTFSEAVDFLAKQSSR